MQLLILLQLTIYFALVLSIRPRQCPKGLNDANTPRCVAMDGISDVEKNECRSAKHCCIGRNGYCYALPRKVVPTIDPDKTNEEMLSDAKDIMRSIKGGARFLNIGPFPSALLPYGGEDPYPGFPRLPAFVCHKRPRFPDNCDMEDKKALRYTRNPPLNIPYCIRIPCDPDLPELDESRTKCREMPGCFFDVQLRDYRKKFGHSVMAGVPVCQLAIRNKVFLEEARKVKDKTGEWTPYLNECLLDTFDEIIRTNHEGCKTLEMLEYFKHKPKIAGWKGIKEYDCYLIAGCWMTKKCYYPVDVNNVTVSASPTEHDDKIPSALYYGRPPCQKFDDKNAKSAIESYHSCLVSGCKLDKHAQNSYYNYLFDFGKSMDPSDHWVFWRLVESGKYGAHNLDEYNLLPKHDVTVTPFSLVFNYPAKPGESNLIDELLRPGSSSLLDMIKTGSGLQVPPAHQNIRDRFLEDLQGIQTPCSTTFTSFGARPCGPPRYKPTGVPNHCPYRPIEDKDLKPLRGSFEGCCDITLCYHPKEEIPNARSGAATYYSTWSYWTECSATCGKGNKKRWRRCIGMDQSQCTGRTTENESCEIVPCSSWNKWSRWSKCSLTCNSGVSTRTRTCKPIGGFCPGPDEEIESCNSEKCKIDRLFGPWSEWKGSCNPCGKSIYRSRECEATTCNDDDLYEIQQCPTGCGTWSSWSPFGPCTWDFFFRTCQKTRTRVCNGKNGRPTECQGNSVDVAYCIC